MGKSDAIKLRPYQEEAVAAVFSERDAGKRSTLLSMATGTGKTVVFAEIIRQFIEASPDARVLVLAHRGELLNQAGKTISKVAGLDCDLEKSQSRCSFSSKVVLGSVQTMRGEKRLARFPHDHFALIVVDEAHHSLAESYRTVLDWFPEAFVLGVTATAYRGDDHSLGLVFDSVAYDYPIVRGISEGYLTDIETRVIPVKIELDDVSVTHGDYAVGELGQALAPHVAEAARKIAEICADKKTVVFLPLVSTAEKMRDTLRELGLDAREVDGSSDDRQETLDWFERAGRGSALCNSMLLTEGWDCPSLDCIVVLRVTRSRGLYMQMVGRGTRLSPETGKESLLLLDFLWQTKDLLQLVRPASIFFDDPLEAARAMAAIEKSDKPMRMGDAKAAANSDAEKKLEEQLRLVAKTLEGSGRRSFTALERPFQELFKEIHIATAGIIRLVPAAASAYDEGIDSPIDEISFASLFISRAEYLASLIPICVGRWEYLEVVETWLTDLFEALEIASDELEDSCGREFAATELREMSGHLSAITDLAAEAMVAVSERVERDRPLYATWRGSNPRSRSKSDDRQHKASNKPAGFGNKASRYSTENKPYTKHLSKAVNRAVGPRDAQRLYDMAEALVEGGAYPLAQSAQALGAVQAQRTADMERLVRLFRSFRKASLDKQKMRETADLIVCVAQRRDEHESAARKKREEEALARHDIAAMNESDVLKNYIDSLNTKNPIVREALMILMLSSPGDESLNSVDTRLDPFTKGEVRYISRIDIRFALAVLAVGNIMQAGMSSSDYHVIYQRLFDRYKDDPSYSIADLLRPEFLILEVPSSAALTVLVGEALELAPQTKLKQVFDGYICEIEGEELSYRYDQYTLLGDSSLNG